MLVDPNMTQNVHTPSAQLIQPNEESTKGLVSRSAVKVTIKAPAIQLFRALGVGKPPYPAAEINNHELCDD